MDISKNDTIELLLNVLIKLDEMKNPTSVNIKGLDYEIYMEIEEMSSVLHAVNKITVKVIDEICEKMV